MIGLLPEPCYVMLHIGAGPSHFEKEGGSSPVVVAGGEPFALRDDIWIEKLNEHLARHIQTTCEPPHYRIDRFESDRHLYAFVRRIPDVERYNYEGTADLRAVAALSRLVQPTSIGDRYCARVFDFGVNDSAVYAIQFRGMSPDAFPGTSRDWLSVEDAQELRELMPWVSKDRPMHPRVHRAYWNHEYAMRSYYLDARWILAVSGLEALISIGERDLSRQFRGRVRQLAVEFRIDFTDDDLRVAYKLRSKLVHAEGFLSGLDAVLAKDQRMTFFAALGLCVANLVTAADDENTLRITSEPPDARVLLNGRDRGVTPLDIKVGHWAFDVKKRTAFSKHLAEPWILQVSKDGYRTESIELTRGPFTWRSLNGVNTSQHWVLNSPAYNVKLRPATRVLTNDVVEKIQTSSCEFKTDPENLATLHNGGVPDAVIAAMIHAVPLEQAGPATGIQPVKK